MIHESIADREQRRLYLVQLFVEAHELVLTIRRRGTYAWRDQSPANLRLRRIEARALARTERRRTTMLKWPA